MFKFIQFQVLDLVLVVLYVDMVDLYVYRHFDLQNILLRKKVINII